MASMQQRPLGGAPAAALALALASFVACGTSSDGGAPKTSDAGAPPLDAAASPDASHPLCVNGVSADGAYPNVPTSVELLGTLPNLTLAGQDETGQPATIALSDYFEPCAPASRMLVLRVTTGWCGTCRHDLAHTKDLFADPTYGPRVRLLDVLVADDDGNPAAVSDLAAHEARMDQKTRSAVDPDYQLRGVAPSQAILPLYVLVDTKTMQVRNYVSNPDPAELAFRVADELALLDHAPPPAYPVQALVDARFAPNEWAVLTGITTPAAPPPDPSNEKADDAAAVALGRALFSDKALSPSGTVSCATCHDPQKAFGDALPVSQGVAKVDRNAPSLGLAAFSRWQFWDGRADSLWAQAAGPFEAQKEYGSSRLFVAHQVYVNYKNQYEAVWTKYPLPNLADAARFPASGKPGDAAFDAMPQADRDAVTRVLVNVAKSIAAYERTIRVAPNRLDQYVAGDYAALSSDEKKGLVAYMKVGCGQCHWGPRLTDDAFHATRFATGRQDGAPDRGRIDAVPAALAGELGQASTWSDAPAPHAGTAHLAAAPALLGAMKTPPLRGVAETAPYGHGGQMATLLDVAMLYASAGLPPGNAQTVGGPEPWLPHFDAASAPLLVPLLQAMTAAPTAP